MLLKSVVELLISMITVLVLLSCTNFIDAASAAPQEHCCQNELCPIDCVRCDGKASCYDLSDELGCSNTLDKKLLAYEKPPIFVPIILAVLKAQLRREKTELGYRFPDRNCFAQAKPAPLNNQPRNEFRGSRNPEPVRSETPVWAQLLLKLKQVFEKPTTTTTTTETPIWKLLLNKLKAEQNGVTYTTSSPSQSWPERDKTTTTAPPISQTPPWRRTGRPPVTQVPEKITSEKTVTQSTVTDLASSTGSKIVTGVPVTIKETVFFIPPKQDFSTSIIPETSPEETTARSSTTTSLSSSTLNDLSTEPLISTLAAEITTPDIILENITTSNTNITENVNVSYISSVYSNTSQKPHVISRSDQINVPEIPASQTMVFRTESKNRTETPTFTTMASRTEAIIATENSASQTIISRTETPVSSTMTEETATTSAMASKTETMNVTESLATLAMTSSTESVHLTESIASSTVASTSGPMDKTSMKSMSEVIPSSNFTSLQERSQVITYTTTEETKHDQLRNDNETTTSYIKKSDIQAEKWNKTDQNVPVAFSAKTDLPFFATADILGVTVSTEFARTVTESETPSPLQERTVVQDYVNKTLETYLPETKFRDNYAMKSLNTSFEANVRIGDNTTALLKDMNGLKKFQTAENTTISLYNAIFLGNRSDSLDFNLKHSSDRYLPKNYSDINYKLEERLAGDRSLDLSLVSDNLSSPDFTFSNFDTPTQVIVNTTLKYSMDETDMNGFKLYNSTYQKDSLNRFNSTGKSGLAFSVSFESNNTLKDRLSSYSIQDSPQNEVQILLQKLNALVSETLALPDLPKQPVISEFSQTQPETNNVQQIATVTPAYVPRPTTMTPATQSPMRSQATPPITLPPPESATMSPVPWWRQTTLPPFSFDNLFGFTTPPLVGQNWFNPTTSSWDAFFGIGSIPVSQVSAVPTYNANQDRLNNIYDPLSTDGQMQPTSNPSPAQTNGISNQGINTNQAVPANENTIQPADFVNPLPHLEHTTTSVYSSFHDTSTRSYKQQEIPPTTQSSMIFNIFDTRVDSQFPGNFSVGKPLVQTEVGFGEQTSLNYKTTLDANTETKIYTQTAERIPTKAVTISPITFPSVRLPKNVSISESLLSSIKTTMAPNTAHEGYISANLPTATPAISLQRSVTTTTAVPWQTTRSMSIPFTEVISKRWDRPSQTKTKAVTESIPVTRPAIQTIPTTILAGWNPGSNRVLTTDIISSWWAQVHSTTRPPPYVPPTTNSLPGAEQCYEVQDLTGFCQTRSGHYKNPTDCRTFYVCIWDFLHMCNCPPNTVFDDTINVCNWNHLVTCTTTP